MKATVRFKNCSYNDLVKSMTDVYSALDKFNAQTTKRRNKIKIIDVAIYPSGNGMIRLKGRKLDIYRFTITMTKCYQALEYK